VSGYELTASSVDPDGCVVDPVLVINILKPVLLLAAKTPDEV